MKLKLVSLTAGLLLLAACSSSTSPSYGGAGGGGTGGGGPVGSITVGNIFYASAHNGSQNPAVDTITRGVTVTWSWNESGTPHGVVSTGSPTFTSEVGTQSTSGATYRVTFNTAGTYTYNCVVHGGLMTGRIVVP